MTTTSPTKSPNRAKVGVQKVGTFLSGMVMPNIPAFISWGLITTLFIEKGWTPNGQLGGWGNDPTGAPWTGLVGPMLSYLIPLLIAYTGGKMIYGHRGGVIGAVMTMGVIVGAAGTPMLLGAMICGPLAAWILKKLDALWEGKIKSGFEMIVDLYSSGIAGFLLALASFFWLSPLLKIVMTGAGHAVNWLVNTGLIPLASIIVEPAKILFLNNAINHGVLTPLGTSEALQHGHSLLFLVEANPGPGLGLLLAYTIFGVGAARATAPGAILIQFLGGIHEIYFPYVLQKPILLVAMILGGGSGVLTNVIFKSGLSAPAAPGSIFAVLSQTQPGTIFGVICSVLVSCIVTFLVASVILRASRKRDLAAEAEGQDGFGAAIAQTEANKGKKSSVLGGLDGGAATATLTGPVTAVIFACDAGMGSSAMGASVLRKKFKDAGLGDVKVTNKAIANLVDGEAQIIISQNQLTQRAREMAPSAEHVSVDEFMNSPKYAQVVEEVKQINSGETAAAPAAAAPVATPAAPVAAAASTGVLKPEGIILPGTATNKHDAIVEVGNKLVELGAVTPAYVDAMFKREEAVSTYMGNGLAIPHGTNDAKAEILKSAVAVARYDSPIDWDGNEVKFVVGIAGVDKEHLEILSSLAVKFTDVDEVTKLEQAKTADELLNLIAATE